MSNELLIQTPAELEQEASPILAWANNLKVTTPAEYSAAAERLKSIKGLLVRVTNFFTPMKRAQDEAKKRILEAEKKLANPLTEAEAKAKAAMIEYQRAEEAKRIAEQRRLQQIADEQAMLARKKAEAEAAKQREIERQAREKAEAARRAAEEATAAERRKLVAKAATAERRAEAAAIKAETHADHANAVIAPVVLVPAAPPKIQGVNVRKTWKAEVVDLEAFLRWACENKRTDVLLPNLKVLDALAKGLKEMARMPGIRFYEESALASSAR